MPLVIADRVQETTNTTGTGSFLLNGAVSGFQSFSAIGDGNTTYYTATDATAGTWEVGIGTYTSSGTTLSRDTVLASSSGTSKISFGAGTKNVFVTQPAEALSVGNATYTSSQTLTASSPRYITYNATGNAPTLTLPSATTLVVGNQYFLRNTNTAWVRVVDSAGTFLGTLPPYKTAVITVMDNTTAAGGWEASELEVMGVIAQSSNLTSTNYGSVSQFYSVELSTNKFLITWYGPGTNYVYGVVYDVPTATFGSVTQLTATTMAHYVSTVTTSDNFLIAFCSGGLSVYVRAGSVSGTTITLGTAVTATGSYTLGQSFLGWQTFGSTYVVAYVSNGPYIAFSAVTVSGTTVTIGTSAGYNSYLLYGLNSQLYYPRYWRVSSTVGAVAFASGNPYAVVIGFSVSGTTVTISGTSAVFTTYAMYNVYVGIKFALDPTDTTKIAMCYLNNAYYLTTAVASVNSTTGAVTGYGNYLGYSIGTPYYITQADIAIEGSSVVVAWGTRLYTYNFTGSALNTGTTYTISSSNNQTSGSTSNWTYNILQYGGLKFTVFSSLPYQRLVPDLIIPPPVNFSMSGSTVTYLAQQPNNSNVGYYQTPSLSVPFANFYKSNYGGVSLFQNFYQSGTTIYCFNPFNTLVKFQPDGISVGWNVPSGTPTVAGASYSTSFPVFYPYAGSIKGYSGGFRASDRVGGKFFFLNGGANSSATAQTVAIMEHITS